MRDTIVESALLEIIGSFSRQLFPVWVGNFGMNPLISQNMKNTLFGADEEKNPRAMFGSMEVELVKFMNGSFPDCSSPISPAFPPVNAEKYLSVRALLRFVYEPGDFLEFFFR